MDTDNLEELSGAPEQPVVGIDTRIPLREKLLLPAIGAMCMSFNMLVQYYLTFYYTSYYGVSGIYLSQMYIVVQIIAAVIAVAFAMYIDGHTTKWGKYKPWLIIVLVGTALGAMLAFMPLGFGTTGNLVYATITYAIFSIFFTMVFAVRIGMTAAMTKRQDDRVELAISNSVWNLTATYAFSYITLPLLRLFSGGKLNDMSSVLGDQGMYFKLILVLMLIFGVTGFFIIRALKERFVIPPERQEKIGFGLRAKSLFKNKYVLIALCYTLLQGLCSTVKASTAIWYFRYIVGDTNKMALYVMLTVTPGLIGMFFSPFITKKLGIKKSVSAMLLINVITSLASFFVPASVTYVNVYYILNGIGFFCLGIAMPAHEAMLSAAADYGEWKYDTQGGAAIGALRGLMQKIYSSASRLMSLYFGLIGLNTLAKKQTEMALGGIRFAATLLPALLFLILLLIVLRWNMTGEKHEKMVKEVWSR